MEGLSRGSSSSAIDLTGIPTGLASSRPNSPLPSGSVARKRTSWGGADAGKDPLRFNLPSSNVGTSQPAAWTHGEDPLFSPSDDDPPFTHDPYRTDRMRYEDTSAGYSISQPGPSSASLISSEHRPTVTWMVPATTMRPG
ncbi:hypothetical protein A0H81_07103 [Grifola frondosa]|uniref:Uncharacterized protein n=1 Tax=Grifola frondosa TaxID=5627 RepID=A0A1C7M908_GRIFR|nr:hypothetical protein A0H81_07103 [Grifola frondosa]